MKKLLLFSCCFLFIPFLTQAEESDTIAPKAPLEFRAAIVSEVPDGVEVINSKMNKANSRLANSGSKAEMRNQKLENSMEVLTAVANQLSERGNLDVSYKIETIISKQRLRQEAIEQNLIQAKSKKRFTVFFFGPDLNRLKVAETELNLYQADIKELNALGVSETGESIQNMQEIIQEIKAEITKEKKTFSLFGWLKQK